MKQTEKELLDAIGRGAQLTFANADALYNEAQLLGTNGSFARALTLHQISMEECSKIDMLGAAAISVLMGHSIDLKELANRFRQHRIKNYNNAYMSVTTDAERQATKRGEVARAVQIFRTQQADIHRLLNTKKNASLYVDYCDGKFVSPSERITEEMATQIQQMNGFFLTHGANSIRVLSTVASDPDAVAAQAKDFTSRLAELKASEGNLEDKFLELVAAWLDEQSGKARPVSEEP
jgi:AbiV family abortive infection protein